MNGELLSALERLEREKGISKKVLFAAIESALISAAYKIIDDPEVSKEDIKVLMDESTGEFRIFLGEEEFKNTQFGRIAAQTAKQVMIQKIREAERDVIFEKYRSLEGSIVSGSVHRFEKGSIIVELDDTEAVLPKSQQNPKERFRQGATVRAYLLKVDRRPGGLDLILSRSDEGFVRKLFELEVPEISQGIVEIVSIAREAGERTKVAVHSKDEKIDSVGSCVGMRGSRVKEVVKELAGERVDVVRWDEDIKEYVKAAISPVEIYGIEVDRANKEIRLTIAKDQLALLIGKKGRNIRLASKLIGWEIKADAVIESVDVPIAEIKGIDDAARALLENAGYKNASSLVGAGAGTLSKIEGLGAEKAAEILSLCEKAFEEAMKSEERAEVSVEVEEKPKKEEKEEGKEAKEEVKEEKTEEEKKEEEPKEEAKEEETKEEEAKEE